MAIRDHDGVLAVIGRATSVEDLANLGVVFHGTSETFDGPPKPGPYDGVFWTARSPQIAQGYIPVAGISVPMPRHHPHEMQERIRPVIDRAMSGEPTCYDHMTRWALNECGITPEGLDPEFSHGRLASWRIPQGWPTIGDFHDFLDEMGYERAPREETMLSVHQGKIMPAGWRLPGRLIIAVLPDTATARTPEWSSSSWGVENHNRLHDFAAMRAEGRSCFRMADKLQSRIMGNYGHEAIGILPAGLERAIWTEVPAVNYDRFHEVENGFWTPEFASLVEDVNPRLGARENQTEMFPGYGV